MYLGNCLKGKYLKSCLVFGYTSFNFSSSCASIGSLGRRPDEEDVRGIFVTNCTLSDTTNGARIKTWHQSPELQASNIVYENIVMNNVRNPIFIDQNYGSKNKPGVKTFILIFQSYAKVRSHVPEIRFLILDWKWFWRR